MHCMHWMVACGEVTPLCCFHLWGRLLRPPKLHMLNFLWVWWKTEHVHSFKHYQLWPPILVLRSMQVMELCLENHVVCVARRDREGELVKACSEWNKCCSIISYDCEDWALVKALWKGPCIGVPGVPGDKELRQHGIRGKGERQDPLFVGLFHFGVLY